MIKFNIKEKSGDISTIEVPEGINLSLMEVLKGSDYHIEATCGGMALCATCHIEVIEGIEKLRERTEAELDMLDTLPNANSSSRLACQVKIDPQVQGVLIRLKDTK